MAGLKVVVYVNDTTNSSLSSRIKNLNVRSMKAGDTIVVLDTPNMKATILNVSDVTMDDKAVTIRLDDKGLKGGLFVLE